jgi:lipopolysaccharide O-acetyltransferase
VRGGAAALRRAGRLRNRIYTAAVRGSFAQFGRGSVLEPPCRLSGEGRIAVGRDVYVGGGSWLLALPGTGRGAFLEIGDGTQIAGGCTLSAARSVRLGRAVLLARGVYVSDHRHAFDDPDVPVLAQGITGIGPVVIGDGAWLGEHVVVCPGVQIGKGAVIGANAVVLHDVPDHAVAVGAPARVVRLIAPELETATP